MPKPKDTILYDTIGVAPDADERAINKQYRLQALLCHPDKNPEAGERYQELNEARLILLDREKRQAYDIGGYRSVIKRDLPDPQKREEYDQYFNKVKEDQSYIAEIEAEIEALLEHWSDPKIGKQTLNHRFILEEDAGYYERLQQYLKHARLMKVVSYGKTDKRMTKANRALGVAAEEANFHQKYIAAVDNWDELSPLDSLIEDLKPGEYFDENGDKQTKSSASVEPKPVTETDKIFEKYRSCMLNLCVESDGSKTQSLAIKLLDEMNGKLVQEWQKLPGNKLTEGPNWKAVAKNIIRGREICKKRDDCVQPKARGAGKGGQLDNQPLGGDEWTKFHSQLEIIKNDFAKTVRDYGLPETWSKTMFNGAVQDKEPEKNRLKLKDSQSEKVAQDTSNDDGANALSRPLLKGQKDREIVTEIGNKGVPGVVNSEKPDAVAEASVTDANEGNDGTARPEGRSNQDETEYTNIKMNDAEVKPGLKERFGRLRAGDEINSGGSTSRALTVQSVKAQELVRSSHFLVDDLDDEERLVVAWQRFNTTRFGDKNQLLLQVTPHDSEYTVYHRIPSYKYKADFLDFKEEGGLDLSQRMGYAKHLEGKRMKDFRIQAVALQRRSKQEPEAGWAQYQRATVLGNFADQHPDEFKAWDRGEMCKAWGEYSVTGRIRDYIRKAKQEGLVRPQRQYYARLGKQFLLKGKRDQLLVTNRDSVDEEDIQHEEEEDLETENFIGIHPDDKDKVPEDLTAQMSQMQRTMQRTMQQKMDQMIQPMMDQMMQQMMKQMTQLQVDSKKNLKDQIKKVDAEVHSNTLRSFERSNQANQASVEDQDMDSSQ